MVSTIYVALKEEGVEVWRPVLAEQFRAGTYRILASEQEPEEERWEFQPGEVVRCEPRELSGGSIGMVAIERCPLA